MTGPAEFVQERVVLLVERHPLAALHLERCLEQTSGLSVTHTDLPPGRRHSSTNNPSAVIVDAQGTPLPLIIFLRSLTMRLGEVPILIIGDRLSDDELCRLMLYGVRGFVPYAKVEEEIRPAVENLLEGRTWLRPQVLERYAALSSALKEQTLAAHGILSTRESEILGLLQRRLSNKEIGCALGISERTVRFHLHNVFEKLGVHDRYSAVELAQAVEREVPRKEVSAWKAA